MVIKEVVLSNTKVIFCDDCLPKSEEENKVKKSILNNIVVEILEKQENK